MAAAFLASILATALAVPALALTTSNANPKVTVPTGIPTAVGVNYAWSGTNPPDALAAGTTFAVTVPAGYAWSVLPVFAPTPAGSMTFSAPVVSNGGLTQTWTLATFTPVGAWNLALAGGTITTTNLSGTAPVTLQVGAAAPVQIARLTASGAAAGLLVPLLISPTVVFADGISTIRITFGAVGTTCATHASFTVGTTAGTFVATTLPGVVIPAGGNTAVTVACGSFGAVNAATLTLRAPAAPAHGWVSVVLTPLAGGSSTDSSTKVTFAGPALPGGGHGDRDDDRGNGQGARKAGFFAAGLTAATCAAAAAVPAAGAKRFGFAVLTTTGRGKLNVTVALKGAAPNATFTVTVSQAGTCGTPFTIRTNRAGNGAGHQHLALVAGAKTFWVTAASSTAVYVTKAMTVPAKAKGHGHDNDKSKGKGHDKDDEDDD